MRSALAIEVQIELGVDPGELSRLQRDVAALRHSYERALHEERVQQRRWDELDSTTHCGHCIRTADGETTLLCGRHTAAYHALCQATRRRITAQRALSTAEYAVQRAGGQER